MRMLCLFGWHDWVVEKAIWVSRKYRNHYEYKPEYVKCRKREDRICARCEKLELNATNYIEDKKARYDLEDRLRSKVKSLKEPVEKGGETEEL